MNALGTWYNADRVAQSGSVILSEWKARREAERAGRPQASVPISQITPGSDMFDILTGGYGIQGAGVPVTEQTVMAIGAVYACVGIIGGALAALPFHLFKRLTDGRERYDSDLWWLFNESPWPSWTAASAWSFAAQSIGLKGDGFWRIRRVTPFTQAIQGFEPYHPDRVQVIQDAGRNYYRVVNQDGTVDIVDQDDMLHFPGIGYDGKRSITPIRAALRPAGGIALAADEYAGSFFRNGARPDFALKTAGKLDHDAADLLRNTWAARHAGPSNAHLPAILTGGLDVQQLTMSAEDAQLLATRKFQIEDIARIFGVPPHMIGYTEKSTSWGSGIEQMSIGFVRYTLRRYIDAMAQEINRKIWPQSRSYFGEFNVDALLDGDSKAQAEYFAKALGGPGTQGWMTINEVRRLKNLKPIAGGDKLIFTSTGQTAPTPADNPAPETDPEETDASDA
ncbi:phage portal protein [Pseudomonas sp.]|uniref:phage portal protein n=1 Tax=Pseudomonas sp. TaxID=306 RepID=UPI003F2BF3F6